ncbi:MAG: hypothetical protein DRJ62_04370, partial [Thermoprotei archaeon]
MLILRRLAVGGFSVQPSSRCGDSCGGKWLPLTTAYLCAFIGPFGGNMIISMFPVLEELFNVDVAVISLTITLFMIPFSLFHVVTGAMSDAYGRAKVMLLGSSIYCMGSFLASASPVIEVLLASRVIQGVGGSMLLPVAMALIGDIVEPRRLGRAMGGFSMAVTAGVALGPLVGGYMASIHWAYAFILLGLMALLLIPLILAVEVFKRSSTPRAFTVWRGFFKALRNKVVLTSGAIGFLAFVVRMGVYTYVTDALGKPPHEWSTDHIGLLLSLAGFAGLGAGLLAGYLTDKLGRLQTAFVGLATLFTTFAMLALPSWPLLMPVIMVMLGFGGITTFTPLSTLAVEVEPQFRGAASSVYGFLRFMGYALGPPIL